ncbi:MAG: AMIN domain-containing protein [Deltaproteobacteria bacterium]
MKKRLASFACLLAVSAMFLVGAVNAQETQIKDVRFSGAEPPGGAENVQVVLSGKNIPKVTVLEGDRPRIVIDFMNAGFIGRKNFTIDTKGDYVKRIRIGIYRNHKTRIVLDLTAGTGYLADQVFDHQENIYKIQVKPE